MTTRLETRLGKAALIALRLVVGWHFLYEGVFKLTSGTGAVSYSPARPVVQLTTARLREALAATPSDAPVHADQWHDDLVKAFIEPNKSPWGAPILSLKRMEGCASVWITRDSIKLPSRTNICYLIWMILWIDFQVRSTSPIF